MLISVVLALVIYFLSNTFNLVTGHPYVNFAIFAVVIFILFGVFTQSRSSVDRNYWLW